MSSKMGDEIDEGRFSLNLSSIDSETHLVDFQRTPSAPHDDVFKCSLSSSDTLVPSGRIHSNSKETNLIKSNVSTVPCLPTNIPDLDYLLGGTDEESSQQQGQVFYNRTIDDDVSIDGIEDDWGDEEMARAVGALRRAFQCMDEKCLDTDCKASQFLIKSIEEDLCSGNVSYSSRKLLESVIKHNECCDEISCTVPWCSFFHIDGNKTVASLMRLYKQVDLEEDFLLSVPPDAEFIKLYDTVAWPSGYKQVEVSHPAELRPELETYPPLVNLHLNEPRLPPDARNQLHGPISSEIVDRRTNALMPRNGIDYLHEIQSVSFGQRSVICVSTTIPTLWLSFTQRAMAEHNKEVWQELRNLDCENIQKLLWICVDSAVVTICNKFNFETNLDTVISKVLPHGSIHGSEILKYTLGLVNAVRYLANIHICYLYWTASSIKMNENYTKALLSDFSLSVSIRDTSEAEDSGSEDSCSEDPDSEDSDSEGSEDVIDFIMPSLPPYILTPEIFTGKIGLMTDVWGIGCIMYHMTTGFCLHHQHRHEDPEKLREMVEQCNPSDLLTAVRDSSIREILSEIFTEHTSRIKLEDLNDLINRKLEEFE